MSIQNEGRSGPGHGEPGYPILPAANRHWLTPFYDLLSAVLNLGRAFQRDVLSRLALRGDERLLDVGCGTGTLLAEVGRRFPRVSASGVDADPAVLKIATRRLRRAGSSADLHAARAEGLPFGDATFDVAVSTLTLHHLPTPAKRGALREVYRVLRPGGRLMVVDFGATPRARVPWWQRLFETVEYLEDHVRGRLPALLEEAGFTNVRRPARRWPSIAYLGGEKATAARPGPDRPSAGPPLPPGEG